jgi:predicted site-specific integrase-resolvase
MLAELLGVAPSTVKRWFAEGEFEHETERWSRMFDENGALIPLTNTKVSLHQKDTAQR